MLFKVNERISGDVIHVGGRTFKKGVVYDSKLEKIPEARMKKIMDLAFGPLKFFLPG